MTRPQAPAGASSELAAQPQVRRSGPGSRPRVNYEERREAYLRIAASVFLELGLNSATMQDVANAAGVQKLLIYRIFGSKQALLDAILSRVIALIHEVYKQPYSLYGARVRDIVSAAKACPEPVLLVLRYSRAGVEQSEWGKAVEDTISSYSRARWFTPAPGAPPGAEARAEIASRLNVGPMIDTMIAWIENRDGLTDAERLRWWGGLSREYHLGLRKAYRLGPAQYEFELPPDVD